MEQIERLKVRLAGDQCDDALLNELLEAAKGIIFERRFPFSDYPDKLEVRYLDTQLRIAVELFGRLGAEGQTGHSENGISRSWSGTDVSPDVLAAITPKVGVP